MKEVREEWESRYIGICRRRCIVRRRIPERGWESNEDLFKLSIGHVSYRTGYLMRQRRGYSR